MHDMDAPRPFILATAAKPVTEVYYHEVPVPTTANVQSAFAYAHECEQKTGEVDVTALADLALRFTCLAYRRNAAGHGMSACIAIEDECAELQFSAASGAHAVLYLYRARGASSRLLAVLSFKGSTANLDDWRANLQAVDTERSGVVSDVPLMETRNVGAARVHPGWRAYLRTLEAVFELARTDLLPEPLRAAWRLAPDDERLSIWQLLHSERVERMLPRRASNPHRLTARSARLELVDSPPAALPRKTPRALKAPPPLKTPPPLRAPRVSRAPRWWQACSSSAIHWAARSRR